MEKEKVYTDKGSYEVECFGHFNVLAPECLKCDLRSKCSEKESRRTRVWVTDDPEGEHWIDGPELTENRKPSTEYEMICPFCGNLCFAEWKDIGYGVTITSAFLCKKCGAAKVGVECDTTNREVKFGFFVPTKDPK